MLDQVILMVNQLEKNSTADGDEMSDSFTKDPNAGFHRPSWEKNGEKRPYKNYQRVQLNRRRSNCCGESASRSVIR